MNRVSAESHVRGGESMRVSRHLCCSILLIFPLLLFPIYADGFSATASVSTCEIPGGGGGPGVNCRGVGATYPSSMTAQASGTLISSNGKTSITGNATVNGPSLTVSTQIQSSGNGVNAGINSYSASADTEWDDTLTLVDVNVLIRVIRANGHHGEEQLEGVGRWRSKTPRAVDLCVSDGQDGDDIRSRVIFGCNSFCGAVYEAPFFFPNQVKLNCP